MKKYFLNKYAFLIYFILIVNLISFLQTDDIGYLGKIVPKVQKKYENYFKYKATNTDKLIGEIYNKYEELEPAEMIAVDVIVNKKIIDFSYAHEYASIYFDKSGQNYTNAMVVELANKAVSKAESIIKQYKYSLFFYKLMPHLYNILINFIIVSIGVIYIKKSKRVSS